MSDRTLDNRTFKSKRLAALSILAFGLFPYIFQQTDDWGCLIVDTEIIKAQRFPKIKWIDEEMIELALKEYSEVGMLFLWEQDGYRYGFFVRFEMKSGQYLSKRRKRQTPEPPPDLLAKFLKDNNHFQALPTVQNCSYKLSEVKLSQVNKSKEKTFPSPSADSVDRSVEKSKPETPKEKQDRRIETIIEFVKKTWDEDFTPSQIQVLVYGQKREKGKVGFKTYETLREFLKSNVGIKPEEGLYAYLRRCSMDEKTVNVHADKAWKHKDPKLIGEIFKDMAKEAGA